MTQQPSSRRTQMPRRTSEPRRARVTPGAGEPAPATRMLRAQHPGRDTSPPQERKAQTHAKAAGAAGPAKYRGMRGVASLLLACFAFLVVAIWERDAVAPLVETLSQNGFDTGSLSQEQRHLFTQISLVPVVAAVVTYGLTAVAIRTLRFWFYLRGLRRYTLRTLRAAAPLERVGVETVAVGYNAKGERDPGKLRPAREMIQAHQRLLLLGDGGMGKTATVLATAAEVARRRFVLPLVIGRGYLPVLVPLASYAQELVERGITLEEFVERQVGIFGTTGLVARTARALRRGWVLLLCDGLDDVLPSDRLDVCKQLSDLANGTTGKARVVVTLRLDVYSSQSRAVAPLAEFARAVLEDLPEATVTRTLRQTRAPGGTQRPKPGEILSELRLHGLAETAGSPAGLAALRALWGAEGRLPFGRGQLYTRYAEMLCEKAAGSELAPERMRFVLGALASSLRRADEHVVGVAQGTRLGTTVIERLETLQPLMPEDLRPEDALPPLPGEVEKVCRGALKAGILVRSSDSTTLSFANSTLEAACAALWLRAMGGGFGRLNAELLRPQWLLPLLLWAGAMETPADLAERLRRLADSQDSTSVRAGLKSRDEVAPLTLLTSLTVLAEGLSAEVAALSESGERRRRAIALGEQHLRDVLDLIHSHMTTPEPGERIAAALEAVEARGGLEVAHGLIGLASLGELNRLARAQIITLLGMTPIAPVLDALAGLLAESDPLIRQAVNQAYVYAGAQALPSLRAALTSSSESTRTRAGEVLELLGEAAVGVSLAALEGADAGQRATAARTLGALRAAQAEQALIGRLDDGESVVRVAAAQALGRLATQAGVRALEKRAAVPDAETRAAVAQALGVARDGGSYATLVSLLNDGEGKVRAAAATALGLLGDERAVPALQERRADQDPWAQNAVVSALRSLGY